MLIGAIDVWEWAGYVMVAALAVWLLSKVVRFLRRANQVLTPARLPVDPAAVLGGFVGRREVDPEDLIFHPARHQYWVGYVLDEVDSDLRGFNYSPRSSLPTATDYHPLDPQHQATAARLLEAAIVNGEAEALDPSMIDRLAGAKGNPLARHLVGVYQARTRKRRTASRTR